MPEAFSFKPFPLVKTLQAKIGKKALTGKPAYSNNLKNRKSQGV
jgi:hypothetical protein